MSEADSGANAPEEVFYAGVHTAGPENFPCIVLFSQTRQVIFPVWVSPEGAAQVLAHESGGGNRRPDMVDVLKDLAEQVGCEPQNVQITDYNKGVAYAYISLSPDYLVDARPSDAISFARLADIPILVTPSLLSQYGIPLDTFAGDVPFDMSNWIEPEDVYPDLSARLSAVGDEDADASFAEMMKNLGFDEDDLIAEMSDELGEDPQGEDRKDS
ncbi:bifunctional nuclease family protein [Corynebacterium aquilae]|uniref:BFN domain-containing protein n=1 Tax=Corynebacterium aquilae DSM 44791 TaxID=1431546 RepID=A0A1L7CFW6_9CORY|nr:bifunctional nuclease domain-containing protein [Corynebacterium aquilae]APT84714.1 hypothetical protein CAQU_06125 [Corynebacterium aquilae DSM 44791]